MDPEAAGREAVVSLICLRLALMPDVAAAKQAAGVPIEDRAQEARVIERVRARSARPDATAAVYRQLIELAKAVQRGAPAAPSHASLDELRAALGRIDEQLVGELDRAPRGSPDEWRTSLARSLDDLPIDPTAVEDLVSVLTNRDAAT
jgi:cyclohexadienyl dehydratase